MIPTSRRKRDRWQRRVVALGLGLSLVVHGAVFALWKDGKGAARVTPEATIAEKDASRPDAWVERPLRVVALRALPAGGSSVSRPSAPDRAPEGSRSASFSDRLRAGEATGAEAATGERAAAPAARPALSSKTAAPASSRGPSGAALSVARAAMGSFTAEPEDTAARLAEELRRRASARRARAQRDGEVVFRAASSAAREAEEDRRAKDGSDGLPRTQGDLGPIPTGRRGGFSGGGTCRVPGAAVNRLFPSGGRVRIGLGG